jgi:formyl-CoA transferase
MSGWPVRFDGRPPEVKPAPLLGQHGEQVLADWLGYDATRINALKDNEVVT